MNDVNQARLRDLFLRTCDLSGAEQKEVLDRACGDDASLREEIESLLRHDRELGASSQDPLERDVHARLRSALSALETGTSAGEISGDPLGRVNQYLLLEKIGEGGMGVVFRAEDTVLRRAVALKFLTGAALKREGSRKRFLREARLAAGLNHPNICTVYELGEVPASAPGSPSAADLPAPGTPFIAAEFIEGSTLTMELRRRGRMPVADLMEVAIQTADGLAAAHARGIVHRDLKPGNIMLTPDGRLKILDFGLAKAVQPQDSGREKEPDSDISEELTRLGMVMGTTPYMSPEQARGEALDIHSDIFSFGIILYEMLAGHRPFRGQTAETTRLKIIESDPESLPREVTGAPRGLEAVILRCLQKRPEERFGSAGTLREALVGLRSGVRSRPVAEGWLTPTGSARQHTWLRPRVLAAVVGAILVLAVGTFLLRPELRGSQNQSTSGPPVHTQITFTGTAERPSISPDGKSIAFVDTSVEGTNRVMIQDIGGEKAVEICRHPGIFALEWAPDGLQLVFTAKDDSTHLLAYTVPRLGGTPRPVPFPGSVVFATWSPDGKALAATSFPPKEVWIHDLTTGDNRTIQIPLAFEAMNGIDWSPQGDWLQVLFRIKGSQSQIWTLRTDGGAAEEVVDSKKLMQRPWWGPGGDAIYYALPNRNTKELWKQVIDPTTGKPTGQPTQLMTGWQTWTTWSLSGDARRLVSARRTTTVNTKVAEADSDGPDAQVTVRQITSGTQIFLAPSLSPDGSEVVAVRGTGVNGFGKLELAEIVIVPLDGGPPRQITSTQRPKAYPAWSPDGTRIAYMAELESGGWRIFVTSAEGGETRELNQSRPDAQKPMIWAPAEKILYWHGEGNVYRGDSDFGLRTIDPAGGEPRPVLMKTWDSIAYWFTYSPDGSQVVYSQQRLHASGDPPEEIRIAPVHGGVSRLLIRQRDLVPLEWSSDGKWIYAVFEEPDQVDDPDPYRIRKINVETGAVSLGWEPPPNLWGWGVYDLGLFNDGKLFMPSKVDKIQSDIWLVENFDPAVQ